MQKSQEFLKHKEASKYVKGISVNWPWIQPLSFLLLAWGGHLSCLSFTFFFYEIRIMALCVYIAENTFSIISQRTQRYTLVPSLLSAIP